MEWWFCSDSGIVQPIYQFFGLSGFNCFLSFSGKKRFTDNPGLSLSMAVLLFSWIFCPGFSLFHNNLCRTRAVLVTSMIHIQRLFRWRGMGIVTRGKRRLFLGMMLRMGMDVIQGVVSVLFVMPVLVRTCLWSGVWLVIMGCWMWFTSWCHIFSTILFFLINDCILTPCLPAVLVNMGTGDSHMFPVLTSG